MPILFNRSRRASDKKSVSNAWRGSDRRQKAGVTIASSLRYDGVSHTYGDKATLKKVSLEIKPGEVVCLLGPSGSGKTTLLRLAAGLVAPQSGKILINNAEVSSPRSLVPPEKRGVGLVFQDFALFPHMSVQKNVEFGLTELSAREKGEHARRMLETVGMLRDAETYPNSLSGGEQQRVALARALAPKPGILLLDEPFSGLDSRLREQVRDETLALLRETRSTVMIVTHDPEEAMKIGDRIVLMREGEIVQEGACETLFKHPNSLFAARFFSELNVFNAKIDGDIVSSELGPLDIPPQYADAPDGTRFHACLRPGDIVLESVELDDGKTVKLPVRSKATTKMSLQAYVTSRKSLGNAELLKLAFPGDERVVQIITDDLENHPDIKMVTFCAAPNKVHLFPVDRSGCNKQRSKQ